MTEITDGRIGSVDVKGRIKLDKRDLLILKLLAEDSRVPLSRIGSQVGLSRDAVDYRIKQLINKKVILRFLPVLRTGKFGYNYFHVFFLLEEKDRQRQEIFINGLNKHPNVKSVIEYNDRWDLEVVFVARDILDFDAVITEFASEFGDIIKDKLQLEVIHYYKSVLFPHDSIRAEIKKSKSLSGYKIDEEDLEIIAMLSENARISTYKVAEKLGTSADKVSYRIKKLLNAGFIENFSLILNLNALKYQWYTYAIQLKVLDKKNEFKFREYVKKNPHIMRAVKVMGRWDLLLYLVVNNMEDLHETIKQIKIEFGYIINTYDTWLAYKEHMYKHIPRAMQLGLKKKKVLVFGTFDVLHPGHLRMFKDAKKYGDHLTVVVARDSTVTKVKGSKPKYDQADRLEHVKQITIVDLAVLGNDGDKYRVVKDIKPDVICLGYDQITFTKKLIKKLVELGIQAEIVRLMPYKEKKYKSSIVKA